MPSQESLIVRQILKQFSANQTTEFNLQAARKSLEMLSAQFPIAPDVTVEKTTIEAIPAEWVAAPNAAHDRVLLYLHGGAYFMGSLNTHRDLAAKLSQVNGSTRPRY